MLVCAFSVRNCTRDRGCSVHPVFPAPSKQEGQTKMQTSGDQRREKVASYSVVIVQGGRSSIPETFVIEPISRGVLDPRMRGDDDLGWATLSPSSQIEKLVPQPHDAVAFGLTTRNEAPIRS